MRKANRHSMALDAVKANTPTERTQALLAPHTPCAAPMAQAISGGFVQYPQSGVNDQA
jgi:hypothetical protein